MASIKYIILAKFSFFSQYFKGLEGEKLSSARARYVDYWRVLRLESVVLTVGMLVETSCLPLPPLDALFAALELQVTNIYMRDQFLFMSIKFL